MRFFLLLFVLSSITFGAEVSDYLTFDNQPLGSVEKPLVMRTFLPDLKLGTEVLGHHAKGRETPRYSHKTGIFAETKDQPVPGIPAAFAVNHGKKLSYVWDTTECRLLYAWCGGFLDMESYWGSPDRGQRKKNDYVPRLVGNLFFKAQGVHPLRINGKVPTEIKYLSHLRKGGSPGFHYMANGQLLTVEIKAGDEAQTMVLIYKSKDQDCDLSFDMPNTAYQILSNRNGQMKVLIRPNAAGNYTGYQKKEIKIVEANVEAGEKLYISYGCSACHTTDGGSGHGPTFHQLADSKRTLDDGSTATADVDYLIRSIKKPNAQQVKDYPAGMMPAYSLSDLQIDSLVLYIQSLK